MTAPLSVARLPPRRRRRPGLVVLVVLFALLLLLSNLVPLAAEWLWFQALGYERVFTTRLAAEAVLGVGVGGLVFAFLYVNLRIAQRGLVPNPLVVQLSSGAAAVDVTRLFRRLALPTALGVALLFGLGAAGGWLGVLQFLHRTPFGVTDPVFGRDVGYYVFTVPLIAGAIGLVIAVTTLTLLATVGLYALRRDIVVFRRQVTVEPSARLPHRGDAAGLGAGQRRDARPHRRGPAHRAGHPSQPADDRQRPTVGPRPAAPDVRAAAGDPHLLRLRLGGRRPLLDRWAVPPGAPLAARAELGFAPHPDLHQRAAHLHARDGTHARAGEPSDVGGTARPLHQGPAARVQCVAAGDAPGALLRRARRFVGVRPDRAKGVRLPLGRAEHLHLLCGNRGRSGRLVAASPGAGDLPRLPEGAVVERHHERQPRDVLPEHPGAGAHGAAVLVIRQRPLPRRRRFGPAPLDPRRVHRDEPLPLRAAPRRRHHLHAQQREGRDRRLRRHRHGLRGRPARPAGAHPGEGVSRDLPAARCDVSGPAGASALPRGPVPGADRPLRHLPHGRARRLLPPGGPVAEAGVVAAGRAAGSLPAPHRDAAAGGAAGGVHSDGAVHAARQGQPGGVDGGAKRRGALRPAGAVSLPQAEPRLRPDPDRQPHQPAHRGLAPDFAVGPARLRGDPRPPARHPDRGVADLRAAALPAGRGRTHPGDEAGRRRSREPSGHGGDARGRVDAVVRGGRHGRDRRGCCGAERRRRSQQRGRRRSRPPGGRVVPARRRGAAQRRLGPLRRSAVPAGRGAASAAGRLRRPPALVVVEDWLLERGFKVEWI